MLPLAGRPLLERLLERLYCVEPRTPIIVATTSSSVDDCITRIAADAGCFVFRGSEENVLERFSLAAQTTDADAVIRICSDCPLIDPMVVSTAINLFYSSSVDYLSNTLRRTFPRGYDVEIFTKKALLEAHRLATLPSEKEHVTPYIYSHPELFTLANLAASHDDSEFRLTVDTKDDFLLVERIFSILGTDLQATTFESVRKLLHDQPQLKSINAHVQQKR
jgi:spore coat polysaccharide biosynthesis protein SpsF